MSGGMEVIGQKADRACASSVLGLLVGVVFWLDPSSLTRLGDPPRGVEVGVIMSISNSQEHDELSEENEEDENGHEEKGSPWVCSGEPYDTLWLANILITKNFVLKS